VIIGQNFSLSFAKILVIRQIFGLSFTTKILVIIGQNFSLSLAKILVIHSPNFWSFIHHQIFGLSFAKILVFHLSKI